MDGGLQKNLRAVAVAIDAGTPTAEVVPSGTDIQFDVDGDRPDSPAALTAVEAAGLGVFNPTLSPPVDEPPGIGIVDTTRGFVVGLTATGDAAIDNAFVAGIGDTLKFNINVTPQILKIVDEGHKVGLGLSNARLGDGDADATPPVEAYDEYKFFNVSLGQDPTQQIAFRYVIQADDFGDLVGQRGNGATDPRAIATAYLIDPAGNRSTDPAGEDDGVDAGTAAYQATISFFLDAKVPDLSAVAAAGDTLLPLDDGTISDGTRNAAEGLPNDNNPITYNLRESLSELKIEISGGDSTTTFTLDNHRVTDPTAVPPTVEENSINFPQLRGPGGVDVAVEFKGGTAADVNTALMFHSANAADAAAAGTAEGHSVFSGVKTIKFTATDFGGNSATVTRSNVNLDVDNLTYPGLFPHEDEELTTIEDMGTADVRFTLEEAADTLIISYNRVSGRDRSSEKRYILSERRASEYGRRGGLLRRRLPQCGRNGHRSGSPHEVRVDPVGLGPGRQLQRDLGRHLRLRHQLRGAAGQVLHHQVGPCRG